MYKQYNTTQHMDVYHTKQYNTYNGCNIYVIQYNTTHYMDVLYM